jgi:transcription initiation factor IIE alpha subunit
MCDEKTFVFSSENDASFAKQTNEILKLVASKQVISLEELKKEVGEINKNSLLAIIAKLKEEGLICCSNLLAPTTFVITARGLNNMES